MQRVISMDHNKQYNYCLDFLKGIACLFVVWMHCEFPGKTGVAIQAISRFSVPFFFMISGFFSGKLAQSGGISLIYNNKVKHILKITLWSSLFYFAWAVISNFVWQDKSLSVTVRQIIVWLAFNQPVIIAGHIWFLYALLYDYILVSLLDGIRIHDRQFLFGAISLVLLFVFGQGFHLLGILIPNYVYRNWLIEGLAFFMLGRWVKENKNRVVIPNSALILIIIVSTLLCLLERSIIGRDFGVNLFTFPQVTAFSICS